MLTPEQIRQARQSVGLDPVSSDPNQMSVEDRIAKRQQGYQAKVNPKPVPEKSTFQNLKEDVGKRVGYIKDSFNRQVTGEQNPISTGLQVVGQVAGGIGDAWGAAIKGTYHALPDQIEKSINKDASAAGKAFLHTKVGQAGLTALQNGMGDYTAWSKLNPEAAANIEAVVNIVSLLPIGKAGEVVAQTGLKKVAVGAKKLIPIVEKAATVQEDVERQAFLKNLVRPLESSKRNLDEVGRTTETGQGLFRKTEVKASPQEEASIEELKNIPTVHPGNSNQQNWNAVRDEISNEAQTLEKNLSKNDFIFPKKELKSKLITNAKTLVAESPVIVGDAEKIANKLINKFMQIMEENPAKATGLLKARKAYDQWAKETLGSTKLFDPKTHNAYEVTNKMLRDTVNIFLDEKATNVEVKRSLARQSRLYNALDNIRPKAAREADTVLGRLFDWSGRVLGEKNRAVQIMATIAGIGGLGAASTFAPAVATLGGAGTTAWLIKKAVTSPSTKRALVNWLRAVEKAATAQGDKATLKDLQFIKGLTEAGQSHEK